MWSVYIHTTPNGKVYIGITSQVPKRRWQNGKGYWSNEHFNSAIIKYGWDNIKHEVLFSGLTKEEAEQKEIELIAKYKSRDRRYGYNIEGGGALNCEVSESTREKLRLSRVGFTHTEETKRKMRESHLGEKCHLYGKHLTEEQKENLRKHHEKPVMQYDKSGNYIATYNSMKEAAKALGCTRQAIYSACVGKSKYCRGYAWKLKEV